MQVCTSCGRKLSYNDIGATKKFINRASTEFLCIPCLCEQLHIPKERMLQKIEHFKRQGCTLFI